jgi:chorismate mutase
MNRAGTTSPSLDDIRREIDSLDGELLNLLERRFAAIEKIKAAKLLAGEDGRSPMRPGREAVVLRRLERLRRGPLTQALMVRLWRSIMSAATLAQVPTTVHVSRAVMAEPRLISGVVEHYPGLEVRVGEDIATAAAVAGSRSDIAVFPCVGSWMEALAGGAMGGAKVIGCLPLIGSRDRPPDLLIFGHAPVDATGEDSTVVLREGSEIAPRLKLQWSVRFGDWTALCLNGCLEPGDEILTGCPIHVAGHYPSPIEPRK